MCGWNNLHCTHTFPDIMVNSYNRHVPIMLPFYKIMLFNNSQLLHLLCTHSARIISYYTIQYHYECVLDKTDGTCTVFYVHIIYLSI